MRWTFRRFGALVVTLVFSWFGSRSVFGRTPIVDLRCSASDLAVDPGRMVTVSLVAENRGDGDLEASEELELPKGWTGVSTADSVFPLVRGESRVRLLSVAVPRTASRGPYLLRYRLRDRRQAGVLGEIEIAVQVLPTGRLDVSLGERPDSVLAGEVVSVPLVLANRGNCPVSVLLECRTSPEAPTDVPPSEVVVDPGAERKVAIAVRTSSDLVKRHLQLVQIRAQARWAESGRTNIALPSIAVEVLPLRPPAFDPYHRLPARLATTVAYESGRRPGIQTELTGRGAVDDTGRRRLDFVFRGPDGGGEESSLRRRDEYGVSYRTTEADFHLGDRSFALSPLLQSAGQTRGLGFDLHPEGSDLRFGLFSGADRESPGAARQTGAYVQQGVAEGFRSRAHWLGTESGTNGPASHLVSLQGVWDRHRFLSLELETGFDPGVPDWTRGSGWRAELRGLIGEGGGWSAGHSYGGPDFHGAMHDGAATFASGYCPITDRLRLSAELRTYANNVEADPSRSPSSLREQSGRIGPRYRLDERTELALDLRATERGDALPPADVDSRELGVRAAVTRDYERATIELAQEVGWLDDRLAFAQGTGSTGGDVERTTRTSVSGIWRATPTHTYTASFSYRNRVATGIVEPTLTASLGGTWRAATGTTVSAGVTHEVGPRSADTRDGVRARTDWRRANGHEVALEVRATRDGSGDSTELSARVTYSIPLDLPVGRRRGYGTLRGTVTEADSGSGSGTPLARAIVRLDTGETAVTDRGGRYVFAGLKPGKYTVSMVPRSLGFGRVTRDLLPGGLEVGADAETTLDIAVVTGARLTVRLTVFEEGLAPVPAGDAPAAAPPAVGPRERGPLAGEVVELSNATETHRRQTSDSGEATFAGLRPGRWSLKVYDSVLPPMHVVERPERTIELPPGAAVREEVRVLPRKRKLKLIAGG